MASFIPEAKLLEIKEAAPIAEVIGQYVSLKPRGRYLVGLCPFHAEKTPSFTVYPERNIFHCYGCGVGGNVFTFLMQHLRLTFPEAATELAKKYGIPLNLKKDLTPAEARASRQRQALYEVNELAAKFFTENLGHPHLGKPVREYLARRGLPEGVAASFRLGFAPDDWRLLIRALSERGASLEAAQQLGLIVPHHSSGYYDRFRGRLIFPILDLQGRVIAFGGRIIADGEPKYLNSPESSLYSKGRNLYGLFQAREAIRKQNLAILVEGYMDLLALRARNIEPVVATLGTALTREQVRLLKGYTSRAVLVFDGDEAGLKAMRRSLPHFAGEHLPVRVLVLPPGEDPDSYAAKQGVEIFRSPWEEAKPLFEYILDDATRNIGDELEKKLAALETLRPYFQSDVDPVEKALWLRLTAKRLTVSESALEESLANKRPALSAPMVCQATALNLERSLIKFILANPEILPRLDVEEYLEQFTDIKLQTIARQICNCHRQLGYLDHSLLVTQLDDDDLCRQVCSLSLAAEEYPPNHLELLIEEYRRSFRKRQLKRQQKKLRLELQEVYQARNGGDFLALVAQVREIEQRLRDLESSHEPLGEKENMDGQRSQS
ncbi:MAG TPA: DNA primase [Desulfobacterales bacterium]|nr:DNA primase [Desulfobacterales bacterium]